MSAPASNLAELQALLQEAVAQAKPLQQAAGSVTATVGAWLAPQYLLAARKKLTAADAGQFEVLRMFVRDWALLQRSDHLAARLQLDRERLENHRVRTQAQKEKEFRQWMKKPEVREKFFPKPKGGLTKKTLEKIERELHLF